MYAKTKYYLAARFPLRPEMEQYAVAIKNSMLETQCTASWVFGGEEGLTRPAIATLDLEDIDRADTFILFTHKYGSKQTGGGRFVELGYAIARDKRIIIIGDYENVFCSYIRAKVYPDWAAFVRNEIPADVAQVALTGVPNNV